MSVPNLTSPILRGLSQQIAAFSTAPIYPGIPIPIFSVVHAVRVFIGYQQALRANGAQGKITFAQGLFGYLTMAWGGTTLSSMLLAVPPVWTWNGPFFLTFVFIFTVLSIGPIPKILSRTPPEPLALLDGLYRPSAAIATLHVSLGHSSTALRTSPYAAMLLGSVATGGGGMLVSTFGLAEPEWVLRTPAFLKGNIWQTLDIWGGGLAVTIYALLTGVHEGFVVPSFPTFDATSEKGYRPIYSEPEAKALAIIVATSLFMARAFRRPGASQKPASVKAANKRQLEEIEMTTPVESPTRSPEPVGASPGSHKRRRKSKA